MTKQLTKIDPTKTVYVLTAEGQTEEARRELLDTPIDGVYEDGRRVFLNKDEAKEATAEHNKTADEGVSYYVEQQEAEDLDTHVLKLSGLVLVEED